MSQDQEDLLGLLDHKAPVEHQVFQEMLENQDQWVSEDIEDLMDLQGNLEQMGSLVLGE